MQNFTDELEKVVDRYIVGDEDGNCEGSCIVLLAKYDKDKEGIERQLMGAGGAELQILSLQGLLESQDTEEEGIGPMMREASRRQVLSLLKNGAKIRKAGVVLKDSDEEQKEKSTEESK